MNKFMKISALLVMLVTALQCGACTNGGNNTASSQSKANSVNSVPSQPKANSINPIPSQPNTSTYNTIPAAPKLGDDTIMGTVGGDDVNIRDRSSIRNSNVIDSVNKGERLEALGFIFTRSVHNWYKVRLANGKIGYISSSYFKADYEIDKLWKPVCDKNGGIWNQFVRGIQSVDDSVSRNSEFHDDLEYYGKRYLSIYSYITDGSGYTGVFDKNGIMRGLIVFHYERSPRTYDYYWRDDNQLQSISKENFRYRMGTDANILLESY